MRSLWHEAELSRKRWGSLDLSYLVQRRKFYEAYVAELIFAVSSPDELAFYLGSGRSAAARVRPACSISGKAVFSVTVSEENSAPRW